jgi:hypothetical protein
MAPTPFGEKTAWWAFKTETVDSVLKLLVETHCLKSVRTVGWDDGVAASYDTSDPDYGNVLLTPPIDGFVLATSQRWLNWWGDDIEVAARASEWVDRLGVEIQYFASERVSGLYGWGKVTEDFEDRTFVKRDHTVLHQAGAITEAERHAIDAVASDCVSHGYLDAASLQQEISDLRNEFLTSLEHGRMLLADGSATFEHGPFAGVSRDDLRTIAALCVSVEPAQVAARWSVDPNLLDERPDADGIPTSCWVGTMLP